MKDIYPEAWRNIHTLVLERTQFYVSTFISGDLIRNAEAEQHDDIADCIARDLAREAFKILAPGIRREEKITVPDSWWDHLKRELGWKYRKREIVITTWHICPHLPYGFGKSECAKRAHLEWLYAAQDGVYPFMPDLSKPEEGDGDA